MKNIPRRSSPPPLRSTVEQCRGGPLKIAVVGGGSTYTPELVDGLGRLRDAFPLDELVLVDPSEERLELVAGVGRRILARGSYSWPSNFIHFR